MNRKKFSVKSSKRTTIVAAATLAVSALTLSATPAFASSEIHIDGVAPSDGVYYTVDQYGVSAANNWNNDFQDIYYPNEVYGGDDYFYCGENSGNDVTITNEANGDVTVDCPPVTDTFFAGTTTTVHFRFYAESPTGYLSRQWIEITNNTGSNIDVSGEPIYVSYYYNYYGWETGDPWLTSDGNDTEDDGDVWGVGGDTDGTEIATASAWAGTCSKLATTYDGSAFYFPASTNVIPANSTVNLLTYFNMSFPVLALTDAATAQTAFDASKAQAEEYSTFGGRLTLGLPTDKTFIGWTGSDCALPDTGADAAQISLVAGGALVLALAGVVLLVARRRRNA